MSRASQNHLGRPMAILIDGTVVMAPVIKAPMSTSATITGQFTREEAERIVSGIRGR
jgi:preprotein translocase subunit SecD